MQKGISIFVYIASHITISIFNTLIAYRMFYLKSKVVCSVFMLAFSYKSLWFSSSLSRQGNTGGTNSIKDGRQLWEIFITARPLEIAK